MSAAVAKSDIIPFIGKGLKVLWLQDSTIAIVLAIVFAAVAVRPGIASKQVIILLALIPMITAALTYHFIGNFVGGHIFLVAGVALLVVFALWLIGWFNGVFPSIMWPILGFIFLPTTLIWYTAVAHWYDGVWTAWRFVVLIFALAIDVSPARGRSNGRSA